MPLAKFPVDALQILDTGFGGRLVYNPHADLAPVVWHGFTLDIDVELDVDWPEPLRSRTSMDLGALLLPKRWSKFEGSYGPVEDQGDSSVYLLNQHVPIDIQRVTLEAIGGTEFAVVADITIAFDGLVYENAETTLRFQADYSGIGFSPIQWGSRAPRILEEWGIPKRFDVDSVTALLSRFADLDEYRLRSGEHGYRLRPV
ncbi:MAG: hypothetical protein JJ863_24625 [Deltaproteobacteria bacterium]|nr:hypothetical protein [Deltaproteobacteria bacterium]